MLKSVERLINAANSGAKQLTLGNHRFERGIGGKGLFFYYHSTAVCIVDEDGKVTYNNGGWNTTSTKRTINSYKSYYGESK